MQHIELYYKKINRMLSARGEVSKQKGKGLLSPDSTKGEASSKDKDQMKIIADIVDGIRTARKEMKNGK